MPLCRSPSPGYRAAMFKPRRPSSEPLIRTFPLLAHLRETPRAASKREHIKIGFQNWIVSYLLANAGRVRPATPARFAPRVGHWSMIEKEAHSLAPKDEMLRLVTRLPFQARPLLGRIDWETAIADYAEIDYPAWYLQPQHSFPGGYLCPGAALDDRAAMEARYQDAHPRRSLGVRASMAQLVPDGARRVIDFGAGVGDLSSAIAQARPEAQVLAVDASPFMQIVGKRMHAKIKNLRWIHAFAEGLKEPAASVDAVTISLVLHEVPDGIKHALLAQARRLLKPGGTLVLCDVPSDDLERHRGAFEPYRQEWRSFDPDAALKEAGFADIVRHELVAPQHQWHRTAHA